MAGRFLKPRVGVLALTLEFYETLAPDLRVQREKWLRDVVIPALAPVTEIHFTAAVYRREDVDAAVTELETAGTCAD